MIGAMATGAMNTIACQERLIFEKCGSWNQGAFATPEKSIELL